jgi:2,3-bisphosphoglycerate-dependent phosphoglycerate mutase
MPAKEILLSHFLDFPLVPDGNQSKLKSEMPHKNLTIYLIRHGETDWNRAGKFQGHTDIPLNDLGHHHGRRLQPFVRAAGIQAFWSSDLQRAKDTAKNAAEREAHIPLFLDRRLRECLLGEGEGLTDEEQRARFGDALVNGWRGLDHPSHWDLRFPDGESSREVVERVLILFDEIRRENYSQIAIATHGGVIRRLLKYLNLEPKPYFPISNGLVFSIQWSPEASAESAPDCWKLSPHLPIAF